jgi:ABC-2 type transport system ATP-binding protein
MSAAVEIVDVARRFGAVALAGVDLLVEQGEFFGLLGPNGAGKTTLISIVAGLTRADRGTARVLGHDVVTDYRRARRLLGVVPQELVFDPFFTVRETLRIQSGYFGLRNNDAWIDEILHHLDLASKADANMRARRHEAEVLSKAGAGAKPPGSCSTSPPQASTWSCARVCGDHPPSSTATAHDHPYDTIWRREALAAESRCSRPERLRLDTTQNLLSTGPDRASLPTCQRRGAAS